MVLRGATMFLLLLLGVFLYFSLWAVAVEVMTKKSWPRETCHFFFAAVALLVVCLVTGAI
jgi:hypothetical protein